MFSVRRPVIVLGLLCIIAMVVTPSQLWAQQAAPLQTGSGFQTGACGDLTLLHYTDPACDAEMTADPFPPVRPLDAEQDIEPGVLASYTYMQITSDEPVTVYDAPDGSPLYVIDSGFRFVTPRAERDGWVEIDPGEWLPADRLEPVEPSRFAGVLVEAEPPRPFGWVLENLYASVRPGGPPVYTPEQFLPHYHLTYVYAAVTVDEFDWYLVGPGQWVEQRFMGLVQRVQPPEELAGRWVAVDLYEQTLVAYESTLDGGEQMVFATLVSSGIAGFSTAAGLFQVWDQRLHGPMTGAEGRPDYYLLENVPFALYFDRDISLHGTYWHDGFGYRRSHGCVNLSISDAYWLYDWLGMGDWVYVYYSRLY
ncbi:MAG: L,D-transpeptidase [Anaerolineae bacterium]|nr:L,D-transpeptidase [Anaerolineae bacterium]